MIPIILGSVDFQLGNPNRWKIFREWKYAYIYRLNTKIRLTMRCLSGFELSSPNLDCIKFSEEIGEINCVVELWFCLEGLIINSWWSMSRSWHSSQHLYLVWNSHNWSHDAHNCKKTMINIDVLYIISLSCDNVC